jgi:hypothetical protein
MLKKKRWKRCGSGWLIRMLGNNQEEGKGQCGNDLRLSADIGEHRISHSVPSAIAKEPCPGGGNKAGRWLPAEECVKRDEGEK